jgi:predicted phage terminase large subunit-like protein
MSCVVECRTEREELELLELLEEEDREAARTNHLDFMAYTWVKKEPFMKGFHTRRICAEIDAAMENFRQGVSTYILIAVHPRSGKTDLVSRYLGPHFLGEFPDKEVLQVSYQANLAASFSTFGRNVVRSSKYRHLYPKVTLSNETNKKDDWVLVDEAGQPTGGRLYASGLQSGLTGNGFHLGVLDDYCSGRAEAESKVFRDKSWQAFTDDFMTRRAPVCICIVLATQWHVDDINGRIKREMAENPDFPQFKVLSFPAKAADYTGEGTYPGKYLFLERYDEAWYRSQYATLGPYSSSALFDCNPIIRTGGRFDISTIDWQDEMLVHTDKRWARIWDLAHTAKERAGDDPDWTSGTLLSFFKEPGDPVPHLYVANVTRTREGAAKRDRIIKGLATSDGPYVRQALGYSLDAKDAFEYLKAALPDISWTAILEQGDKGARATPLEPIFAAPYHVHVKKGDWNNDWIDELLRFDGTGKGHDDQVDNLSDGYTLQVGNAPGDPRIGAALAERRARR